MHISADRGEMLAESKGAGRGFVNVAWRRSIFNASVLCETVLHVALYAPPQPLSIPNRLTPAGMANSGRRGEILYRDQVPSASHGL